MLIHHKYILHLEHSKGEKAHPTLGFSKIVLIVPKKRFRKNLKNTNSFHTILWWKDNLLVKVKNIKLERADKTQLPKILSKINRNELMKITGELI
uniref:Uncharacterized protein n=1 Tax=viral metagenome TaxID=1070528 RepID=A0A6M3L4V6_9ZZZZ